MESLDLERRWSEDHALSYREAWDAVRGARVREGVRAFAGFGLWVACGVVAALAIWLDVAGWPSRVLVYGPMIGVATLWWRRIPFDDFFPGPFVAGAIFAVNVIVSQVGASVWWVLYGVGVLVLAFWGWKHCGGPEYVRYLRAHLSSDPRRAASLMLNFDPRAGDTGESAS